MRRAFFLLLMLLPGAVHALLPNYCNILQLPGWWGSGDYMLVWRKKRFYPPLVTSNTLGFFPQIGNPGTTILFGDEYVGDSPLSGGRGDFGIWLSCVVGFGGTYFSLGRESVDYDIGTKTEGTGEPIIGRPFFDPITATQSADLISFPALNPNGFVSANTTNNVWGGDLYVRYRMLASECFKLDFLGGFRFTRLDDDLDIDSQTTTALLERFTVFDHFGTRNDFYSGLIGFYTELRSQCWGLVAYGKVGLGNMVKKTHIYGQTTSLISGTTTVTNHGLLTQSSNIRNYSINQFEVVPEINAQVQLRVWPHLWFTLGYQYIFWPRVLLAGNQVDLDIDLTQTISSPTFPAKNVSFWAQSLTVGFSFLY